MFPLSRTREKMYLSPFQANLCYLDVDTRTMQLPEELPGFPHKADFVAEINNVLSQFHVETRPNGPVDR